MHADDFASSCALPRHPRAGGDPVQASAFPPNFKAPRSACFLPVKAPEARRAWVPACAGMTTRWCQFFCIAKISLTLTLFWLVLKLALPLFPKPALSSYFPHSKIVLSAEGRLLRLQLANDQRYRLWTPLSELSPLLVRATLIKEDQWFYWHPGLNPKRLLQAAAVTIMGGQRQGGSTISMQLVRLINQGSSKTVPGKVKQIAQALLLELRYSKQEILEAYLNLAPYGRNIEGAAAASYLYFDKPTSQLSLPEVLTLAVLPQRPNARARGAASDLQEDLRASRDQLFALMLAQDAGLANYTGVMQAPFVLSARGPQGAPMRAPHLSLALLAQHPEPVIHSTVALPLQMLLEAQIARYTRAQSARGLNNAAAVLLDWRTGEVKALVGSANFNDAQIQGQINGADIARSPGSTLKPFLYALALDNGLIHEKSVLRDVPTAFGPFTPENNDRQFIGPITAHDALIKSRNIPAVSLQMRLGDNGLYQLLSQAGVQDLASQNFYGLALALGGGELRMLELAGLYGALANGGLHQVPKMREATVESRAATQLFSPEAAFIVRQILLDNPRPGAARKAQRYRVAWKTGTSWAFRDAWSAGIAGDYVLVVWLGRFDYDSVPALTGQGAAAPLFFNILDELHALKLLQTKSAGHPQMETAHATDSKSNWVDIPAGLNVTQENVCAASGDFPNQWCSALTPALFIPGTSPIRISSLHQPVQVDSRTGEAVCAGKSQPAHTRTVIFEFWPDELARSLQQAGLQRRRTPRCALPTPQQASAGVAPEITAPLKNVSYSLRADELGQKSLDFAANSRSARLYWFVNGQFIASAAPGQSVPFLPRKVGNFQVQVFDDEGRSAVRRLRIERVL
jgi:penicillin-binding protein 1C